MREFTINGNDAGQRVDKFITKTVPSLPQSLIYKYIRLKRIKLNGKRCDINTRIHQGDVLQMYVNDSFFENSQEMAFLHVPAALDVIYEDENILLIDKKPGLVVHEDESGGIDTLINRILHYLYDKEEYRPQEENSFVPALCNRIDRNTGGIVIAAKNAAALRVLNQKIKDREIQKLYLCIVLGHPRPRSGVMTAYLEKDAAGNKVTVSDRKTGSNRTIVTAYRVLEENQKYSLVEVDLRTGRTHQIRAHFAYAGYPLLGDGKYGIGRENRIAGLDRQALYAYRLTFHFTSDSGCMSYLDGKTFTVPRVWFRDKYFPNHT